MDLDAETLALLTPEEIAAIRDEPSPDELDALKAIADGADDEGDEGDEGDGDDAAAAAASPAPAPAPAPAADAPAPAADDGAAAPAAPAAQAPAPAAAAPEPAPAPEFKPQYVAELPDDFDARKTANATAEAEAYAKFEAGDLDAAGLRAALTEASSERTALDRIQTKYEIATETRAQSVEQTWVNTVSGFMSDVAKNEGVDYRKDAARAEDLDTFVKALAKNDANADKPMSWFLTEAHKRVKALYGDAPAPALTPAPAPAPTAAQAIAAAAAARKPNAAAAPKTLAQVPGGDGPGDIAGEFAGLDNLEGDALEDAIARMSPAMREKYSRGL